ncbi:MAG: D-TA family PLP-dependent enzyme [Bacteroidota bacterium]|nr:D-TA family PLP-dependent enzyme [Bacteroidota bacterium]
MWYKPENETSIATPCVLLFPDRIEENIRRMIAIAGSAKRLRPHVKTHKTAEVIKLQQQQGIEHFKCATLSEVALVAEASGKDILLAYPLLGPSIKLWFDLMEQYPDTRFSLCVDSEQALAQLEHQARRRNRQVDLFVDIDNGMHRTGMDPEKAYRLIHLIANSKDFHFRGLHIYDGHIHETDPGERKKHCDHDFKVVNSLVDYLEQDGISVEEQACGGTPTFPIHATYPSRTLCPGTPLLWDAGYMQKIPDLEFFPAAVVAGRVISKPGSDLCLDLGTKSLASEMPHPRLHFLGLDLTGVSNHSEEHLVINCREADQLSVGDLVYALPTHICPTMALHEEVYVVQNRQVTLTWKVAARQRTYPI